MRIQGPLCRERKEKVYWGKLAGQTLAQVAAEVGCSVHTARKWWRVGRDRGLEGLRVARKTRGKTGILSSFKPQVAEKALELKKRHPGWGAKRVLVELGRDPLSAEWHLPSRSRLAEFFKKRCPECVASRHPRPARRPKDPGPTYVHERWQLDNQERIRLGNGQVATICSIRDPVAGAMIASRSFSVGTKQHWRKLAWTEVQDVLRSAFAEWQTMPVEIQTDNELAFAGDPTDPFPGKLTLWLAGLGVGHRFIRPAHPTDQPQIERNHRTLQDWAFVRQTLDTQPELQQALDRERAMHNHDFPSQASDCAGRPPLVAHPELKSQPRPYRADCELLLFDQRRVYDYLAQFTFRRKVNSVGRVSIGRQMYTIGRTLVRERGLKIVIARLDPTKGEWVFTAEGEDTELVRRTIKGLDVESLTSLDLLSTQPAEPFQLPLPFPAPDVGVRSFQDS